MLAFAPAWWWWGKSLYRACYRVGKGYALLLAVLLVPLYSPAGLLRTQTITLEQGWNAVYLEVDPVDLDPAVVFTNSPVDQVAVYVAASSPAQFMTDPSADMPAEAGWGVWYEPNRPDAFLRTLFALHGQQAYLIHATSNATIRVTGSVALPDIKWKSDAYNLVGFSVVSPGAPTFAQFFAGSPAHAHDRIYRLADGAWRRVTAPDAECMRSGEAFWIYCDGASNYQGPLQVETSRKAGLVLREDMDGSVILRNRCDHPVAATVEHVPAGSNAVPLSVVVTVVGDPAEPIRSTAVPQPDGAWTLDLPPLEGGGVVQVPLAAQLENMAKPVLGSLLRVTTDLGTEAWLPVIAARTDLEGE